MSRQDSLNLIKRRLSSLPGAEKRLGAYILEDPQRAAGMTMRRLAAETGVSEGSVANFASRLGYDGWSALKLSLVRSISAGEVLSYDDAAPGDSVRDVMAKMRDNTESALRATYETTTEADLLRAVEMLTGAKKRIEIYGIGSSSMLAEDAAFRLMKLGLPAVVVKDSYISSVSALNLDSDCLAIAISYTGRTHDIIKTMSIAREKGARTLCITCYADSPLAKLCEHSLIAVSGEAVQKRLATVSRLAQLMLVDTLCAYIAYQRSEQTQEMQNEIVDAWDEYWLPETSD